MERAVDPPATRLGSVIVWAIVIAALLIAFAAAQSLGTSMTDIVGVFAAPLG